MHCLTWNVCGENPWFISFNDFSFAKYTFTIWRHVLDTHRKMKHSRIVRRGNNFDTKISSQYKSNMWVFLFLFMLLFSKLLIQYFIFSLFIIFYSIFAIVIIYLLQLTLTNDSKWQLAFHWQFCCQHTKVVDIAAFTIIRINLILF